MDRACMTFVTDMQFRTCCAGIETGTTRSGAVLSTYLGHAHVTDTYWYLTGTPELLGAAAKRLEKLSPSDIGRLLNAANQGPFTIQTMIFEPATLQARLSFGPSPSSARQLKTIELGPLLGVAK